jgi:AcrR family transcriptional regulator
MSETTARPDGRTARSARTREAVVGALEALLYDGVVGPGAAEIAERAGVSTRSVYVHFESLDDLFRAVSERATTRVLGMLSPIDPASPLDDRVQELTRQRARINEEVGPIRRAGARREAFSAAISEARTYGRQASREQIDRIFAPELAALAPAERRRRVAAVDALVSGESWDLLRSLHDLTPDEARRTVAEATHVLLLAPPGASSTPPGAT